MLAAVVRANPNIRIELVCMSMSRQRSALVDGAVDMSIIIGEMDRPNVDTVRLVVAPLMVGVANESVLAAKKKLALTDVLSGPILIGNAEKWSALRDVIFTLFAEAGVTLKIVFEASSAAAMVGLVAKVLGLIFYAGVPKH